MLLDILGKGREDCPRQRQRDALELLRVGAHLGEVLWVSGDRAEAERIWKEALQVAPENEALQKTIKRFKP